MSSFFLVCKHLPVSSMTVIPCAVRTGDFINNIRLPLQGNNRSGGGSDAVVVDNSCKWFRDTFDVW